jgi:FAD/FMN-containing dehydrogenase/uncharacterized membrane protein YhaH (DUF805 family)/SAM-dependent methyltransferase
MQKTSSLKDLQFFELFVSFKGRISRCVFWLAFFVLLLTYFNGYLVINYFSTNIYNQPLYWFIPFAWAFLAIYVKRLHDFNQSGYQLLWLLVPLLGLLYINWQVFFRKGKTQNNRYGTRSHEMEFDYFTNPPITKKNGVMIVNDVTEINPIVVTDVLVASSTTEIISLLKNTQEPICIGGGRFSMGGQTASTHAVFIDMRRMNQILEFSLEKKCLRVQAGIRWCDIQKFIDPFGLAIMVMQTYANFTVGGALSVNAHGRYMGYGPVALSVLEISLITAQGELIIANAEQHNDIFYAALGGYGGIGIIVEAELQLVNNVNIQRCNTKLSVKNYRQFFVEHIANDNSILFHNADIYPKRYQKVNAVSWKVTDKAATHQQPIQSVKRIHPLASYFIWAIAKTPFGKWRREHVVDNLLFAKAPVHARNFEAGYNVAELTPIAGKNFTWVLQEYFVPVRNFYQFQQVMAEILQRYNVNALNISIRHANTDPGTWLAWAREEVYAFVLYYRQNTDELSKTKVAIWTRELTDAVIKLAGTYYLPYQIHATCSQFHQAYPKAKQFFALKQKIDPQYRLQNQLWNTYYKPAAEPAMNQANEFSIINCNTTMHDKLYLFLQNIFHLYPEDKMLALLKNTAKNTTTSQACYEKTQQALKSIKPFFSDLTYALPALAKQKQVMLTQSLELLGANQSIDGYIEIGSAGRYLSRLKKRLTIRGSIYLVDEKAPGYSPVDILERGQVKKLGQYIPLNNYAPLSSEIPDASIDLLTCYIGLHHIALNKLDAFIASIVRVLRPQGRFILRDHNCPTDAMRQFCSLIHSVFNIGTQETWQTNQAELRHFRSVAAWCELLKKHGLISDGHGLLQAHDPSDNTLMIFTKGDIE